MPYPIRRKLGLKRGTVRPRPGAVVWTLGRGGDAPVAALPPLKVQGGVEYLSGGIAPAEAEAMRRAQSQFPLVLEFVRKAAEHDTYIIDVAVDIVDRQGGTVLAMRTDGPRMLVRLPDGEYTVKAAYFGHVLERRVRVAGHASARTQFVWDMQL
jgi:hypothetical protein